MLDGLVVEAVTDQNVAYGCEIRGCSVRGRQHNNIERQFRNRTTANLQSSSFVFWFSTGKGIFFCSINSFA